MRYILDTHVFLWWLENEDLVAPEAREAIRKTENSVYISTVSLWEIAIKSMIGKIDVPASPSEAVVECSFSHLDLNHRHVDSLYSLPALHRDPFDRMLVAQATVENCILVTRESAIIRYDIETLMA